MKRDYEGNTPLHTACKSGSLETLEWLLSNVTSGFLEMQNDFGFTPLEAAEQKALLYEEEI